MLFGRSVAGTCCVLTMMTRARAAKAVQVWSAARSAAGNAAAAGLSYGSYRPCRWRRMVLRISLFQWTSQRGRSASRLSSTVRLTDLVASVSNFGATARPVRAVKSASTASANSLSWAQ